MAPTEELAAWSFEAPLIQQAAGLVATTRAILIIQADLMDNVEQ